ncbi:MAG TPA: ABC transporter ATP-binding protein [Alphaproteobacteria bacterium]|nr:ABC transporter ATP-binding protein [Alphaproteobacteria bacterium]
MIAGSTAAHAIEPVSLSAPERRARAKVLFSGVSKRFGEGPTAVHALERMDVAIQKQDFLCVVGPSGCGKSTLLNILAGFEAPSSGDVTLDGRAVLAPGAERGVVFQQGALFTWMSVLDNVAFGPLARGKSQAEAREIATEYINLVGLRGFADRYPYELSGGMQQRVGIARALANEPEVLLMDEPFAALDQQTRELLQEEIKAIWQRTGKTILWITHSIEEALFLATHILVMTARPGRIKASFAAGFSRDPDPLVTTTTAFSEAKREILRLLRDESIAAQRQEGANG